MFHVYAEARIKRGIRDVFDIVADLENDRLWCPEVIEIERTSTHGPGVGATYTTVVGPGPMKQSGTYEIIEFVPPTRVGWTMNQGSGVAIGSYSLERADAATILRYHTTVSLSGIQRLLEPMVSLYFNRKRAPRMLQKLKLLLESTEGRAGGNASA